MSRSGSVTMTISGHRTINVFQRYNITSSEDKTEALHRRESDNQERDEKLNVVSINRAQADGNADQRED
jgi:hypothetical protein